MKIVLLKVLLQEQCFTTFLIHETEFKIIRFAIPIVFIIKLDWSVCTCLTQPYDGRDMYRIYYIKNYMFQHFTLANVKCRNM